ncbi:penicillin-insensitive murein endopeptidase [Acidimangrovimonas sediminis]|uniref:penicillin-insensitive murein endopeptidase n=1 Tax=Acidimangrovimonas sediminis TaxID=2056283 RepID=UPI000C80A377|nr:penicillin-insensitive murein endopeptidase [Acidimangrovimonas sediminis]
MGKPFHRLIPALLAGLALVMATSAGAQPLAKTLFGAVDGPSRGPSLAIGSYSRGCAQGLVRLPQTGPTWQAMRLSRDRNWGMPETVSFIEDLSRYAATLRGWNGLYVGDIGQPRGGPMASGHASHQMGLDVDIWMLPGTDMRLSRAEREKISSIPIRTADQRNVTRNWDRQHYLLMRRAAMDPRVDRIFVAAAAKIAMCNATPANDRGWLQKIRPWFGHNYHFHVRLKCPSGDPLCRTQRPTVAKLSKGGDGCDATLNWWVTDLLNPPKGQPKKPAKPKGPPKRTARTYVLSDLPSQCATVLSSP